MIIYLLGNPLLDCDSTPLKLKPHLEKALPNVEFLEFDPTEDWPDDSPLIFIDTVINLKEPKLFTNVDDFIAAGAKQLSVHGFDFYQELKLRKKMGLFNQCSIIGLPPKFKIKDIYKIIAIIKNS